MAKAKMRKDLKGKRFGKLLVLDVDEERTKDNKVYWNCQCDCGNKKSILAQSLSRSNGGTKSCGCNRNSEIAKMKAKITSKSYPKDISGFKFGKLYVESITDKISDRKADRKAKLFKCICDCGNVCYYSRYVIISSSIKSCGCLYEETRGIYSKSYNKYDLETNNYGVGHCSNGSEFYFDKEDYDKIKEYCWNYDGKYVQAHTNKNIKDEYTTKIIRLHRVILDIKDKENISIDHINNIRYDCRKENLRKATTHQNSANKKNCCATIDNPVGINKKPNNKYSVSICKKYYGTFDSFEEAFNKRKELEKEKFGEFRYDDSLKITL